MLAQGRARHAGSAGAAAGLLRIGYYRRLQPLRPTGPLAAGSRYPEVFLCKRLWPRPRLIPLVSSI